MLTSLFEPPKFRDKPKRESIATAGTLPIEAYSITSIETSEEKPRVPPEIKDPWFVGIVLKCMDRGISTVKNKKEVKEKKGGYYNDFVQWSDAYEVIQKYYEKIKEV